MKHLETVFNALKGVLLVGLAVLIAPAEAQEVQTFQEMDSVEISLLTCQPHDEVYSLYGHTAIRYHDLRKGGIDLAFNYGVFSFDAPFFTLRFVFGLTDYELGAFPYQLFQAEYKHFGSMVTEQVLNLTAEEKSALRTALANNLKPENRIYRYNYFYNNCTTKARDVIEQCINGKLEYAEKESYTPSYREMTHEMTRNNPWARFGNDLLLGIKADFKTTREEQEFLPANLMYDFDRAQIYVNGTYRPLVKERRISVPAGVQVIQEGFPLTPVQCGWILLTAGFVIFLIEYKRRQAFRLWDVGLMAVAGILGIVIFLMLFSQHPTVSLNLQILLFNPIHWLFLWPVIKRKRTHYWKIAATLSVLFLLGATVQSYAEGIYCLALCLLLQCYIHIVRIKE